jgi:alpha-tubulin suppressor-like RCC1 family protein
MGDNDYGQCDVGAWTDILQIAAGYGHTIGLKFDGTMVAVGHNIPYGQCNIDGWTDMVQVAAGDWHTVGLKSDGTVVAVGHNTYEQCDLGGWDLN